MRSLSGTIKLLLRAALGVLASTSCLFAQSGTGNPVVLNFDSLTPPPQGCVDATEYLAGFGIMVTTSPGAQVGACQNVEVSGNYFTIFSTILNLHPVSATLNFPQPVNQITFTRAEYLPAVSNGVVEGESGPNWTAMAFNGQGQQVGNTVGESLFISLSSVPAVTYTISGNGITTLQISGNNEAFAGFLAPPLDNLTLQYGGCQLDPGSLRWFAGFPLSIDHHRTSMNGIFRPSIGGNPMSLAAAAQACGLAGFNWEQKVTELPCPSPFFANPPAPQNLCPNLNPAPLTASQLYPFNDPPKGGYTSYLVGYDPFPYYYYWDPNPFFIQQGVIREEKTPSGVVIDDGSLLVVTLDDMQLAFYDAPANHDLATLPGATMAFATSLVGVDQNGNPSSLSDTLGKPLMWTWTDNYNHTSGGVDAPFNTRPVDPGGTGGITITSGNGVPQTPPSVSCIVTPDTLWPPNGKSVSVTLSGTVTAGTQTVPLGGITFAVTDEYGQDQPSGSIAVGADGSYSFTVPLIAARDGTDLDGRTYTINVIATDAIGNVGSCAAVVTVPHDQGN